MTELVFVLICWYW